MAGRRVASDLAARFARAMADLGPFGTPPRLAIGVSGGADSMALATLADRWARERGGTVLALIVDHGLRQASAAEAAVTEARLETLGIEAVRIRLALESGPALQARARAARHAAMAGAARAAGIVHLLLGHHAADQDELRAMRALRGPRGAEGMAAIAARDHVILLRPLLGIARAELRGFLEANGIGWIDDPSNADPRFERARIRAAGPTVDPESGAREAERRAREECATARVLACLVRLQPEGWAVIEGDSLPPEALAALLRTVGGAVYPPTRAAVGRLAARLRPATLGGVRIMPAGRHGTGQRGAGWMLVREAACCEGPVAAVVGAVWDGRFRIRAVPPGAERLGALGKRAAELDSRRRLPAAVIEVLPGFFRDDELISAPHLGRGPPSCVPFSPPWPASPAPFAARPDAGLQCAERVPAGWENAVPCPSLS